MRLRRADLPVALPAATCPHDPAHIALHVHAVGVMGAMDGLPKPLRELIHEYGWNAVRQASRFGNNPATLRRVLEAARRRKCPGSA